MKPASTLSLLAALIAAPAAAATLSVEGTVSPAWVERAGSAERVPARASGMTLQNRDRVVTGDGIPRAAQARGRQRGQARRERDAQPGRSRREAERPGAQARHRIARRGAGAFRFTTGIFSKLAAERDVRIRVATVTAGIRGTDLWGKSDEQRDLVCLLEGRISVTHAQTGEITMAEPLAFFVAPRGAAPLPVAKVDRSPVAAMGRGDGARRRGRRRAARRQVPRGRQHGDGPAGRAARPRRAAPGGLPGVIRPVKGEAGPVHRVRIVNLLERARRAGRGGEGEGARTCRRGRRKVADTLRDG